MAEVWIASRAESEVVGDVLAAGFADDPVLTWVFSEDARAVKLRAFFRFLASEALVPLGATYLTEGATACWTPPDAPPWPDDRGRRFGDLLESVCRPDELARLGMLDAATQAAHPETRHWYLSSIATLPQRQGEGLGSALLRTALARVDRDGLPAYLESTNLRNVGFYEHHGFAATGDIELPDGPTLTAMWREPTAPDE